MKIFSYLSHREICQYATVSKKWNMVAQDTKLWSFVSLRPEISGLHIDRADTLTNQIMPTKFAGGNLRYLELPAELITPQVKFSIVFWRWLLHQYQWCAWIGWWRHFIFLGSSRFSQTLSQSHTPSTRLFPSKSIKRFLRT